MRLTTESKERGKNIEPSLDPGDVAISEKAEKEEPIMEAVTKGQGWRVRDPATKSGVKCSEGLQKCM